MKDILGIIGLLGFGVILYFICIGIRKGLPSRTNKSRVINSENKNNQKPYDLEKDIHIIKNILIYFCILSVIGIIFGIISVT